MIEFLFVYICFRRFYMHIYVFYNCKSVVCSSFLEMLETIGLDKRHQQYSIKKITSYAIRATYFIFCCRNKEWTNPELLNV